MKTNAKRIYSVILILYVAALICGTLIFRETTGKNLIQREWFWGYTVDNPRILYGDTIVNILLYIPIGFLLASLAPKQKVLTAVFAGLLLSETIECSQLIWQRGMFDVDDLFNNTVGALVGGLIALLVLRIHKRNAHKE